jgi:hypothetical protein
MWKPTYTPPPYVWLDPKSVPLWNGGPLIGEVFQDGMPPLLEGGIDILNNWNQDYQHPSLDQSPEDLRANALDYLRHLMASENAEGAPEGKQYCFQISGGQATTIPPLFEYCSYQSAGNNELRSHWWATSKPTLLLRNWGAGTAHEGECLGNFYTYYVDYFTVGLVSDPTNDFSNDAPGLALPEFKLSTCGWRNIGEEEVQEFMPIEPPPVIERPPWVPDIPPPPVATPPILTGGTAVNTYDEPGYVNLTPQEDGSYVMDIGVPVPCPDDCMPTFEIGTITVVTSDEAGVSIEGDGAPFTLNFNLPYSETAEPPTFNSGTTISTGDAPGFVNVVPEMDGTFTINIGVPGDDEDEEPITIEIGTVETVPLGEEEITITGDGHPYVLNFKLPVEEMEFVEKTMTMCQPDEHGVMEIRDITMQIPAKDDVSMVSVFDAIFQELYAIRYGRERCGVKNAGGGLGEPA